MNKTPKFRIHELTGSIDKSIYSYLINESICVYTMHVWTWHNLYNCSVFRMIIAKDIDEFRAKITRRHPSLPKMDPNGNFRYILFRTQAKILVMIFQNSSAIQEAVQMGSIYGVMES